MVYEYVFECINVNCICFGYVVILMIVNVFFELNVICLIYWFYCGLLRDVVKVVLWVEYKWIKYISIDRNIILDILFEMYFGV